MQRLLTTAIAFVLLAAASARAAERPNVIFILADDLGYGDLGCYGQRRIKTPHLDRMAAEGMRFTRAYAGSTVCAPSRCVLLTGLHTGHARVRGNGGKALVNLQPDDVTIAEVLKPAGYTTGVIGKWGLGDVGQSGVPTEQGFDYFYGYLNHQHAHNYYPSHLWRGEERVPLRNVVPDERSGGAGVASERVEYSHDLVAEEALAFVRRSKDRPFFLYFTPTLPHANNEAKQRGMEVPDLGEYAALDWPEPQKAHAAMIARLDRDVGRLFALLAELGLDERTVVFFSSDNGPHREGGADPTFNASSGPLRGIKRDLYEGGIRVPMIVRWPGRVKAGVTSEQVVAFQDVLPTVAALAGAPAPQGTDGLSIAPTLLGEGTQAQHAHLYWEFYEPHFKQAVLAGDWKALRLAADEPLELYDLKSDPAEQHDVAAAHPNVVARLEPLFMSSRTDSPDWPTTRRRPRRAAAPSK